MSQDEKDFDLRSSHPTVASSKHLPLTPGTFSSTAIVIQGRLSKWQRAATNQGQLSKLRPAASPGHRQVVTRLLELYQHRHLCCASPDGNGAMLRDVSRIASKQPSKAIVNKTNQTTCLGTERHRRSQSENCGKPALTSDFKLRDRHPVGESG